MEAGEGVIYGDAGRPDCVWQAHNAMYRPRITDVYTCDVYDDVSQKCTPETCIIFATNVTSMNLI